mgnify:CR=1 FL=1
MINEKKKGASKDACYSKVKSRYSVWPSAYASGALVKCRKKGAKNWGNSRKDEALHTAYFNFATSLVNEADAFERSGDRARALDGDLEAQKKLEAEAEEVRKELEAKATAANKSKKKGSKFSAIVANQKRRAGRYVNTLPGRALTGTKNAAMTVAKGSLKAPFKAMKAKGRRGKYTFDHTEYQRIGAIIAEKSAAWTRKEGKNPSGGLNAKGVASYRAKNPGSKLKTAVTTKPSKLKKGSKAAGRRKSFCARMSGMRKRQKASNNTGKDRLSLSLKKWNC